MRKLSLEVFLALALGFLAGATVFKNPPLRQEIPLPSKSLAPARTETNQTSTQDAPKGDFALVSRVIDGDTVELSTGEHLRYIGMDAPEVFGRKNSIKCFGEESAKRNRELVEGRRVRLERDVSEKDKYRRLLRYVWVSDKMINLELVEEGYATAFTYPPDVKYSKEFVAAERKAREVKIGLWQSCR